MIRGSGRPRRGNLPAVDVSAVRPVVRARSKFEPLPERPSCRLSWLADVWNRRIVDSFGLGREAKGIIPAPSPSTISPLGHQPMIFQAGHWVLIFNGKIYTFRGLKRLSPLTLARYTAIALSITSARSP